MSLNYFFRFNDEFRANADPVIGPLLTAPGTVLVNMWDVTAASYLLGFWLFVTRAVSDPQLENLVELELILDVDALLEGDPSMVVFNNLPDGVIDNLLVITSTTAFSYIANGSIRGVGRRPPPATNYALRENGSIELRENGSFCLRE